MSNPTNPPRAPPPFDRTVPSSIQNWQSAIARANLTHQTLYDFTGFRSASEITKQQFLLLRTIVTEEDGSNFTPETFQLQRQYNKAKKLLEDSKQFQQYIKSIVTKRNPRRHIFYALRTQQQEVIQGNSKAKFKLERQDETPVNSTLITLLLLIADIAPNRRVEWRDSKVKLVADFSRGNQATEDRKYTAITDGQLQDIEGTKGIKALVECKRNKRKYHQPQVDMQEAAQMVAWIKEFPGNEKQRVLVSQDKKEIYVTFARYDEEWLNYLYDRPHTMTSLMTMHRYGPFNIDDGENLREAAIILLAITL